MLEIRAVDASEEALLRRLWDIGVGSAEEALTHDHPSWPAARWRWTRPSRIAESRLWAAYEGGVPVGYAETSLPLLDNTRLAEVFVCVQAAERRRGHGSALLSQVVDDVARAGRRVLFTGICAGLGGVPPGQSFAQRHGFALAQYDVEKVLDVAAHRDEWPAVLEDAVAGSKGYEVVSWVGETPAEHVEALCLLMSTFMGEIPLGDLELGDEHWDRSRLWERQQGFELTGRHSCMTLALAADGSAAGYTEMLVDEGWPGIGFQEGTLVLPAHRGHRLGLRLKAVNQLQVARCFPQVHSIETGNAGDNEHMSAINQVLGFCPVGRWLELQRRL